MFKSLSRLFRALFIGSEPTALEVMKKSMQKAEMTYLATLDEKEYHACMAEMKAVEARHDYERCLRLQKFIQQEERSQVEVTGVAIDERSLDALMAAVAADLHKMFPKNEEAKAGPTTKPEPEQKA